MADGPLFCIISPNSMAFGSFYVHNVWDKSVVQESKFSAIYDLWQYLQRFLRTNSLKRGTPCQKW